MPSQTPEEYYFYECDTRLPPSLIQPVNLCRICLSGDDFLTRTIGRSHKQLYCALNHLKIRQIDGTIPVVHDAKKFYC